LNSSSLGWRIWQSGRFGFAEFSAQNPPLIVATTSLPRAILQSLFFTLLGRVVGGAAGAQFAFVGSLAAILTLTSAVAIVDVPMNDKWSGTFHRIRSGVLPPMLVLMARSAPYPLVGIASCLCALVVVGPATGHARLVVPLLAWLPLYLLMSLTTAMAGIAAGALVVGRRADVVAGNLLAYLVLLAGGVFLPPGRLAWVDAVGSVLPIRHGLAAVRTGLAGGAWLPEACWEAAVGAGWAVLAWSIIAVQVRRARASGHDDFA
jgi:ABC-2 type transport system permease protein